MNKIACAYVMHQRDSLPTNFGQKGKAKMLFIQRFLIFVFMAICFPMSLAYANEIRIIVAPHCLLKKVHAKYDTLSADEKFSLIKIDKANINQLIAAKNEKPICGGFMDVTEDWKSVAPKYLMRKDAAKKFLKNVTKPQSIAIPNYKIQYKQQVEAFIKQINPQNMWDDLTILSNFPDRYADSQTGYKAALWFKSQMEALAKANHRTDVSVRLINTGSYQQPSVVAKVGDSDLPGVVIGSHMDTLSIDDIFSDYGLPKPGADDDGTGSVTTLEVARIILSSGMQFKNPIYFMWYAAEEEGLVGSGYVVREFKRQNIPVLAVIHFDMTGYAYKNDPTIWIMDDYVNKDLSSFLSTLIKTYVKQPVGHSKCGYACSDHATWTKSGYPAVIAFETSMQTMNPYIHSSKDTMEKLSLNHMHDFAKLGLAFVVELASPLS